MKAKLTKILNLFFLISYFAVLVNSSKFMGEISSHNAATTLFSVTVWLFYAAVYIFPAYLLSLGMLQLLFRKNTCNTSRLFKTRFAVAAGFAVVAATLVQLYLITDAVVYKAFRFHCNSFVINLLTTSGGMASMDVNASSMAGFMVEIAIVLLIEALLMFAACLCCLKYPGVLRKIPKIKSRWIITTFCLLGILQGISYGVAKLQWDKDILFAAEAFPLYQKITFSKFGRKLGLEKEGICEVRASVNDSMTTYPLKPINETPANRYNVIVLAVESWRADMLTPEIMPATCRFAEEHGLNFTNHYSGGVGTRMGLFSLFYGLNGSYWFSMLKERRPPVMLDVLRNNGYEFYCRTSQGFTYPEFDKTIFAGVDPGKMHVFDDGYGWQKDRRNVDEIVKWLDTAEKDRPFFMFMFFESPHASYNFPPECAIRKNYRESYNYATDLSSDLSADAIRQIFNRYINACYHLDTQLERLLKKLSDSGLLESSIVVITGDHAEEFFDKGIWGHGGCLFHEEQLRVPMIIHIPGMTPKRIGRLSSHVDIPATVFDALGIKTPAENFTCGNSLLGDRQRTYIVATGWDMMVYADRDCKIVFPYRREAMRQVSRRNDSPITGDENDVIRQKLPNIMSVLHDMRKFVK